MARTNTHLRVHIARGRQARVVQRAEEHVNADALSPELDHLKGGAQHSVTAEELLWLNSRAVVRKTTFLP